jgi:Tfp pilus assembly pilus retraction ATPase PilT
MNEILRPMVDMLPATGGIGNSQPTFVREIDFTDLFMSEKGDVFLRGTPTSDGPLSTLPISVLGDAGKLHRMICSKGQEKSEFFADYDGMRFRVSRIKDVDGIWYTLRRAMWPIPKLGQLGVNHRIVEQLGYFGEPSSEKSGLILISGPMGHGKTTTACSLLQEYLTWFGDVALTVEDPVELPMTGGHGKSGHCFQEEVENGDFGEAMKRAMRKAPRYIFLGEIRDPIGASQVLRASINGHIVITTIHAGSCIQAIDSLIKLVSGGKENIELARSNLADGILAVINQRLKRNTRGKKTLTTEVLFFGDEKGPRSMIRDGKTEQLVTTVQQQASRIQQKKLPLE